LKDQIKSADDAALHFRENVTPHQAKSMTYVASTRTNCRRWVRAWGVRLAKRVGIKKAKTAVALSPASSLSFCIASGSTVPSSMGRKKA
jgi:hypothetical protein